LLLGSDRKSENEQQEGNAGKFHIPVLDAVPTIVKQRSGEPAC